MLGGVAALTISLSIVSIFCRSSVIISASFMQVSAAESNVNGWDGVLDFLTSSWGTWGADG